MAGDREEAGLIRRIAAGDAAAFRDLYRLYHRRVFAYVTRITRRPDRAEEVVDDVLLAVWRGAARFDERSKPSSWILGIAYRQALKTLRRGRSIDAPGPTGPSEAHGGDEVLGTLPAGTEGPEQAAERHEIAALLQRAMAGLSLEQRAVVVLTFHYGYSYPEIARILDCPVNTVKTRMFHARKRLHAAMPALGLRRDMAR
jgi:RNA polymerase sigma-70 factor (ECF subfamily)